MSCRQKEQAKPADINPRKFFALVGGLHLTIQGPFSNSLRSAASSMSAACKMYFLFLQTAERVELAILFGYKMSMLGLKPVFWAVKIVFYFFLPSFFPTKMVCGPCGSRQFFVMAHNPSNLEAATDDQILGLIQKKYTGI